MSKLKLNISLIILPYNYINPCHDIADMLLKVGVKHQSIIVLILSALIGDVDKKFFLITELILHRMHRYLE